MTEKESGGGGSHLPTTGDIRAAEAKKVDELADAVETGEVVIDPTTTGDVGSGWSC